MTEEAHTTNLPTASPPLRIAPLSPQRGEEPSPINWRDTDEAARRFVLGCIPREATSADMRMSGAVIDLTYIKRESADDVLRIIGGTVENLLELLDELTGDPEEEPEVLEPYFADCPGYDDECEPSEDTEPSLGSTASIDQNRAWKGRPDGDWHTTYVQDGEQGDDTGIGDPMGLTFDDEEPHDREDDSEEGEDDDHDEEGGDKEPSLGWTIGSQYGVGSTNDAEPNGDEGDFSGSEDDVGTMGKSCSDRPAANAVLAQLPTIAGSETEIFGLDGKRYIVTKVERGASWMASQNGKRMAAN